MNEKDYYHEMYRMECERNLKLNQHNIRVKEHIKNVIEFTLTKQDLDYLKQQWENWIKNLNTDEEIKL